MRDVSHQLVFELRGIVASVSIHFFDYALEYFEAIPPTHFFYTYIFVATSTLVIANYKVTDRRQCTIV